MKRAQQGFTLIELIIVIVILGILAVTAAPRFLNLAGDARVSVIEGMRGSVVGAASIANSRAIIQGQLGATGYIDENRNNSNDTATEIQLVNGFPNAETLDRALDLQQGDWQVVQGGGTKVRIYPNDVTAHTASGDTFSDPSNSNKADICYLEYTEATTGNRPVITAVNTTTTGC